MKSKYDLDMLMNIKTSLFKLSNKEYDQLKKYGADITQTGINKWYVNK